MLWWALEDKPITTFTLVHSKPEMQNVHKEIEYNHHNHGLINAALINTEDFLFYAALIYILIKICVFDRYSSNLNKNKAS